MKLLILAVNGSYLSLACINTECWCHKIVFFDGKCTQCRIIGIIRKTTNRYKFSWKIHTLSEYK